MADRATAQPASRSTSGGGHAPATAGSAAPAPGDSGTPGAGSPGGGEGDRGERPGPQTVTQPPPPRPDVDRGEVRRPADLLLALAAGLLAAFLIGLAHELPAGAQEITSTVGRAVKHIPSALRIVLDVLSDLGCFALIVVTFVHHLRVERRSALNAVVSALLAAGIGIAAATIWHSRHVGVAAVMLKDASSLVLVVVGAYLAFLTGADLARRARWTRWCVLTAGGFALSEVLQGGLTSYAFVVVLPASWAIGLLVRWVLGAASVQPSASAELEAALGSTGVAVVELHAPRRRYGDWRGEEVGSAGTTTAAPGSLRIRLANRDTRGAGLARRLWGLLRLRTSVSGRQSLGRRSQLEQEALACYAAAAAGVLAPRVLALSEIGDATLMLAVALPDGVPFDEDAPPDAAPELFAALRRLHRAGVAHCDLRAEHLLVAGGEAPDAGEAGEAGFSSLETAIPGAGDLLRRIDVAQLLTTAAGVVGVPAAVEAMRGGYAPEDEGAVVAMLQPVALAPWGWQAMRANQGHLAELRKEMLGGADDRVQTRLERFRFRTVLSTVALVLAAYLLVGQLSKVNLLGTLSHTNLGWFSLAIAASVLTYLGAAGNLAAFVPKRLSLLRGFFVQLSTSFVGLAMPPTVGHVAVNARYLHRQGIEEADVTAAVALSQAVNVVTTVPFLLVLGLLTGSGVSKLHLLPGSTLLIGIGALAVVIGVLFAMPGIRHLLLGYVTPWLRNLGPRLLEAVSQPLRLAAGVGGNVVLTLGYIVALGASLLAVGAHPSWLGVATVYLAGNTVGSAAPTPGGLGAVEVVLSAGLTAIGIPPHDAVSAVLLFRLATFWLPIPAGWVSYHFLLRSGTL